MGSKLAVILSMFMMTLVMLFFSDLICINVNYSSLNASASTISTIFAKKGGISAIHEVDLYLEEVYGNAVTINIISGTSAVDTYLVFTLTKQYKPMMLPNKMQISIKRSSYIGTYTF